MYQIRLQNVKIRTLKAYFRVSKLTVLTLVPLTTVGFIKRAGEFKSTSKYEVKYDLVLFWLEYY